MINVNEEPIKVFTVVKNGKEGRIFINRDTKAIITHELKRLELTEDEINKIKERIQKVVNWSLPKFFTSS